MKRKMKKSPAMPAMMKPGNAGAPKRQTRPATPSSKKEMGTSRPAKVKRLGK